jgi:hypothetical protein
MLPIVSGRDGDQIKIEVTVDLSGGMLEAEESILRAVNAVGNVATAEALKRFDADVHPIMLGGSRWYSKGKLPKIFNTPYGVVSVERHVYQPAEGGNTFCPMDDGARNHQKGNAAVCQDRVAQICPWRHRRGAGRPGAEPWPVLPEGQFAEIWSHMSGRSCRRRKKAGATPRRRSAR